MTEPTIICLTHGRAGQVTAFKAFGDDLLLSVAESQVPAYRQAYPDAKIDPHPDTVVGLPAKKNYVYAKFGSTFFADDDCPQMIDQQDSSKVDPKRARALVARLADMAEQMGAYLFGFSEDANPLHYAPQKPYLLTGILGGGRFGLLEGSDLWWPEEPRYGVCEDIWISALNAYRHRYLVRDQRHCLPMAVGQVGGLANVRTSTVMKELADFLVASFGDAIVLKDEAALYNWRLRVPW